MTYDKDTCHLKSIHSYSVGCKDSFIHWQKQQLLDAHYQVQVFPYF